MIDAREIRISAAVKLQISRIVRLRVAAVVVYDRFIGRKDRIFILKTFCVAQFRKSAMS